MFKHTISEETWGVEFIYEGSSQCVSLYRYQLKRGGHYQGKYINLNIIVLYNCIHLFLYPMLSSILIMAITVSRFVVIQKCIL